MLKRRTLVSVIAKLARLTQTAIILCVILSGCSTEPAARQVIATENAPKAIGPYSQAIRVGNRLYLSGQIAIDPAEGAMVEGGIEEQTHQVLVNIEAVLQAAGFSLTDIVQCQVFLSDLNNYGAMNKVYGRYFENAPPARAAVQVARLPLDALVEIMATAVRNNQ